MLGFASAYYALVGALAQARLSILSFSGFGTGYTGHGLLRVRHYNGGKRWEAEMLLSPLMEQGGRERGELAWHVGSCDELRRGRMALASASASASASVWHGMTWH